MHNLHFVKVRANSGEDACRMVESEIMNFGNENNWRAFCGAISEDNEVYNDIDGRYIPKTTDYTTIEKINECVNEWIKGCWYGKVAEEKFAKGETDLNQWESYELWSLSKWAEHLSEAQLYRDRPFDLMKGDTFFAYKYDECGLTNMVYDTYEDDDEAMGKTKEKIWVVFVDMHS